jgi:hypothetical protein
MGKKRGLQDEYQFPGFRPSREIRGIFGDPKARIIRLERTEKKRDVVVAASQIEATTTRRCGRYGICPAGTPVYTWKWKSGEYSASGAAK